VFFYNQPSYYEKISEKTSQAQTIQRTVTSRNVTQGSGNTEYKEILERQSLVVLLILETLWWFLITGTKKTCAWKTTFVSEHLDQGCPTFTDIGSTFTFFSLWRSTNLAKLMSSLNRPNVLHSLPVAVLTIPANSSARGNHAKSAKHIVDYVSHVFFLTCTHVH